MRFPALIALLTLTTASGPILAQSGTPDSMKEIEEQAKRNSNKALLQEYEQYQTQVKQTQKKWNEAATAINKEYEELKKSAYEYLDKNLWLPMYIKQEHVNITKLQVEYLKASVARNNAWLDARNQYDVIQYNNIIFKYWNALTEPQKKLLNEKADAANKNYKVLHDKLSETRRKEELALNQINMRVSEFNKEVDNWNDLQRRLAEERAAAVAEAERESIRRSAAQIGKIRHLNPH